MADQPVQIVDDEDNVVGAGSVTEVRAQGRRHRIARVVAKDPAGRILLQKRADHMTNYPGRWDMSAAGHVDEGEDYETAASREMQEEIGLHAKNLQEIDYYKSENKYEALDIKRFNKTFEVTIAADTKFEPDPNEVSRVKWFTVGQLRNILQNDPKSLTDGLQDYIHRKL